MIRRGLGHLTVALAVVLGGCGGVGRSASLPSPGGEVVTSQAPVPTSSFATPQLPQTSRTPASDARREYDRAIRDDDAALALFWGARAMSETFPDESAKGLRVDPRIFSPYPRNEPSVYGFDTSILVKTSQRKKARAALRNCTERLLLVSYSGVEFASYEDFGASLGEGEELGIDDDTPEYVSDPEVRNDGVALVFESWMRFRMKVTMIKIVRQELRAAGVEQAFITSVPR
jgi:hypothetical protein